MRNAASTYFEDEILTASPLQLVNLLYQGAITELRNARRFLATGEVAMRCAAIAKACDILTELTSSLNHEAGGDTAVRLSELYGYSIGRLLEANLKKQEGPIVEVLGLLTTLAEGWAKLAQGESTPPAQNAPAALFAGQANEFVSQSWSV